MDGERLAEITHTLRQGALNRRDDYRWQAAEAIDALLAEVERLRAFALDVAHQMAVPVVKNGVSMWSAGGLSTAEEAFEIVGWPDPHPAGGDHAD